jgi:hypothetical protein
VVNELCPNGPFEIEHGLLKVADQWRDVTGGSRNILDVEELKQKIDLGKKKDEFRYRIEAVGQVPADRMFPKAIDVLRKKCQKYLRELKVAD